MASKLVEPRPPAYLLLPVMYVCRKKLSVKDIFKAIFIRLADKTHPDGHYNDYDMLIDKFRNLTSHNHEGLIIKDVKSEIIRIKIDFGKAEIKSM